MIRRQDTFALTMCQDLHNLGLAVGLSVQEAAALVQGGYCELGTQRGARCKEHRRCVFCIQICPSQQWGR